ncbi:hypothetical protein SGQ83_14490 [Flavobacterium sp. Fl-318]|uniref:Uncharacterized protein n=1 Tax=Flavobacterium cupriresistens TaxID=2893885 RepID=A0ABU4RDA8_9FLAO|nr:MULTISPECIES: hypothetical protein [unclassified Flavobacterium]MDX6190567.1 hypothetical protein [Flavobacterium sp. Fl-318]UFH43627.1 hypothetical protein LNP23_05265 [Flavobacterium sp. F-323]
MKESDKNIENLIDKMMAETTLESPSIDFTSKLMVQILATEKSKVKAYAPLISKQIWFAIAAALITMTIYVVMTGGEKNTKIDALYAVNFADLLPAITISNNILYAFLVIPFMILIQIPLLKNYYERKYPL